MKVDSIGQRLFRNTFGGTKSNIGVLIKAAISPETAGGGFADAIGGQIADKSCFVNSLTDHAAQRLDKVAENLQKLVGYCLSKIYKS